MNLSLVQTVLYGTRPRYPRHFNAKQKRPERLDLFLAMGMGVPQYIKSHSLRVPLLVCHAKFEINNFSWENGAHAGAGSIQFNEVDPSH